MSHTSDRILDALARNPELEFEVWRKLHNKKYAGPWEVRAVTTVRTDISGTIVGTVSRSTTGPTYFWSTHTTPMSIRGEENSEQEAKDHVDAHLRVTYTIIEDRALWSPTHPTTGWVYEVTGKWVYVLKNKTVAQVQQTSTSWKWLVGFEGGLAHTSALAFKLAEVEMLRSGVLPP